MSNKILLNKNPNGFGCRQKILIILAAPCLEWISKKINRENVDYLLNYNDCNNPEAFTKKSFKLLSNPNIVGCLIIEMGCGTFNLNKNKLKIPLNYLDISKVEFNMIEKKIDDFIESILRKSVQKFKVNSSEVLIGLKCGGSTKFSQDKLNPFVGEFVDKMIERGYRFIFNEPQETLGLDEFYNERTDNNSFNKWKEFCDSIEKKQYMNKGNIEGGIKNLHDKSKGSIKKIGNNRFTVINLDEKCQNNLFQILGTNQEPLSQTQMTAHSAICHLYITGFGGIFGTGIAPSFTITTTNHNHSMFDYNFPSNQNVLDLVSKFINFIEGEESVSEKLGINLL